MPRSRHRECPLRCQLLSCGAWITDYVLIRAARLTADTSVAQIMKCRKIELKYTVERDMSVWIRVITLLPAYMVAHALQGGIRAKAGGGSDCSRTSGL